MIIDNDNFLVVGPKLDIVYQINALARLIRKNTRTFRPNMVWVAHASNVRVECLESFLRCKKCYVVGDRWQDALPWCETSSYSWFE